MEASASGRQGSAYPLAANAPPPGSEIPSLLRPPGSVKRRHTMTCLPTNGSHQTICYREGSPLRRPETNFYGELCA